jgi:hypothetical protein
MVDHAILREIEMHPCTKIVAIDIEDTIKLVSYTSNIKMENCVFRIQNLK